MAPQEPSDTGFDVDELAAALRADAADLDVYAEALAGKLAMALPGGVHVDRRRGRPFGPRRVQRIVVDLGDERFILEVGEAGVRTATARVSGGITLKTEWVDGDTWRRVLSAALAREAQRSQSTRQGLERLLI